MKTTLYSLALVLFTACNFSTPEKAEKKVIAAVVPLSPGGSLTDEERSYYYSLVKNHFDEMLGRNFNGQLLVAKNGTIVYEKVQGFSDLRTHDSLTAETPLHIASTGKTFTAMAILQLVENGKLSLQDSVEKFFPGFPYHGITIKMLLSHRSGLPNYLHYLSVQKNKDTCYSNQDVLNSLFNLQPGLEFKSGTRFSYSNTNFVLLAMILEKITGQPYPVYMKQKFFDPLQMIHTHVHTSADSVNVAPSFDAWGRYWKPDEFDCTYGDKNIYSTARDLLKWDQALYDGKILKQSTLDSAYLPLSNERRSIHNYGLGWRMMIFPTGKKLIYHNGRWHGSNSVLARLTDEKATIIIIGNRYNSNIYKAAKKGYNLFGNYVPGQAQPDEEDDNNSDSLVTDKKEPSPVKAHKAISRKRKR